MSEEKGGKGELPKSGCEKRDLYLYNFNVFVFCCDVKQLHCSNVLSKVHNTEMSCVSDSRVRSKERSDFGWWEREGRSCREMWGADEPSGSEDAGAQS